MNALTRPAPLSSVLLPQIVRADAGDAESAHDIRVNAAYGAFYQAYRNGNKTQLQQVANACATYGQSPKACNVIVGLPADSRPTKAAIHAHRVYASYAAALVACSIEPSNAATVPGKMKDGDPEAEAAHMAGLFVQVYLAHLASYQRAPMTDEEKAKRKAERDAKAARAQSERAAALGEAIDKAVAETTEALAVDTPTAVAMVISALRAGSVTEDDAQALAQALAAAFDLNITPASIEPGVRVPDASTALLAAAH